MEWDRGEFVGLSWISLGGPYSGANPGPFFLSFCVELWWKSVSYALGISENSWQGPSLSVLQSLCCEIKQRRRGVASILRLCQHLLDDRETCHLNADHQPMQLIIVNLERRWEAIVMQAVQWQTRLQKKMGKEAVSDSYFLFIFPLA